VAAFPDLLYRLHIGERREDNLGTDRDRKRGEQARYVGYACDPGTWKVEAGGWRVPGQSGSLCETLEGDRSNKEKGKMSFIAEKGEGRSGRLGGTQRRKQSKEETAGKWPDREGGRSWPLLGRPGRQSHQAMSLIVIAWEH
jgi:hypothetical protein